MIGTAILGTCIIVMFLYLVLSNTQKNFIKEKNVEFKALTELLAGHIEQGIYDRIDALESVVKAREFYLRAPTSEAEGFFSQTHSVLEKKYFNLGIFYFDADYNMLDMKNRRDVEANNIAEYLKRGILNSEASEPQTVVLSNKLPLVLFLRPVRELPRSEMKELAVGAIDATDPFMKKAINEFRPFKSGYVNIVDKDCIVIFSSELEKVSKKCSHLDLARLSKNPDKVVIGKEAEEGTVVAVAPLRLAGWHLIAEQDAREYYGNINKLKRALIYLVLILSFVVVVFTSIISNRLVRPILSLHNVAEEISRGSLEKAIVSEGPGELSILARSMERMRKGLQTLLVKEKEHQEELEKKVKESTVELEDALYKVRMEVEERKLAEEKLKRALGELRGILGETINVIAMTVESRDPYTAGHQQRVAYLAQAIATEMGLSLEQINGLRMVGAIHDVGKLKVPMEILTKPGEISEIESLMIKAHPQAGYDILKEVDFGWPVAQIVLQHHERMNGSGYPSGLSGEEILLEARILAVADVVEAIASHRPYRPTLGIDKALEEISQNRGILFDPEVVDACLKLFLEKGFSFQSVKDGDLN